MADRILAPIIDHKNEEAAQPLLLEPFVEPEVPRDSLALVDETLLGLDFSDFVNKSGDVMTGTLTMQSSSAGDSFVADNDGSNAIFRAISYGSGARPSFFGKTARGTRAAPLRTKANDVLWQLQASAAYGSSDVAAAVFASSDRAGIQVKANADWTSDTDTSTRFDFQTTAPASGSEVIRQRIGWSTVSGANTATAWFTDSGSFNDAGAVLHVLRSYLTPLTIGQKPPAFSISSTIRGAGTGLTGHQGMLSFVADDAAVGTKVISAVTNTTPIQITTSTAHGFSTGGRVAISGTGLSIDNTLFTVTVIDSTNFTLDGSTAAGTASVGSVTNRGLFYGISSTVAPRVDRGGGLGALANFDDVAAYTAFNNGPGFGTEAFYVGRNTTSFPSTPEWGGGYSCPTYVKYWGFGGGSGRVAVGGAFFDASRVTYDAGSYAMAGQNGVWLQSRDLAQTNPTNMIRVNSSFQVELGTDTVIEKDGSTALIRPKAYGTGFFSEFRGMMVRGSLAASRRTKANDEISRFGAMGGFAADDSSVPSFPAVAKAYLSFLALEDWTSTGQGTQAIMNTTATGSTSVSERWRTNYIYGIDFNSGTFTNPIRLKNNVAVVGRNAAAGADVNLFKINASDRFEVMTILDSTSQALATKQKAGAPVDGDWAATPPDGTIVGDSTNSKLWIRLGGTWKGVVVA